jgi:superfamily II DNA/RNA helicase
LKFICDAVNTGITKEIILLTATDSLSDELKKQLNVKVENLKPWKEVERIQLENEDEMLNLVEEENLSVLVFTKYKPDEDTLEEYADYFNIPLDESALIHADVPTSERIKTQLAFKEGKLRLVVSSNVLAQGVNFPADLVVIEYNEYDEPELIHQKI